MYNLAILLKCASLSFQKLRMKFARIGKGIRILINILSALIELFFLKKYTTLGQNIDHMTLLPWEFQEMSNIHFKPHPT